MRRYRPVYVCVDSTTVYKIGLKHITNDRKHMYTDVNAIQVCTDALLFVQSSIDRTLYHIKLDVNVTSRHTQKHEISH